MAFGMVAVGAACSSGSGGASHAGSTTTAPTNTRPTTTLPTTTPPTVPSGQVVTVPASIDHTGRLDVTKSLQRLIASVPSGREILFRKGARYRVEGTLVLWNQHGITIDGNGATVFATTRGGKDRAQFWIKGGSRIVFRNLRVRGANPNAGLADDAYVPKLENQHGFRFESVDGAELDHVQVTDVYGDFVYIGQGKRRVPSRNVWVHDSVFARNGRQGISVTSARNVILERNHLSQTRRSVFDLEPDTRHARVSNVFVLNNIVGPGRFFFIAAHGQGGVNNIVISGNRLQGHVMSIDSLAPDRSPRRFNWVVVDNTSDTPVQRYPIRFIRTDGVEVRGNRQAVEGNEPGFVLNSVCGARISGTELGLTRIRQVTPVCNAPLTVPTPPPMPGRS